MSCPDCDKLRTEVDQLRNEVSRLRCTVMPFERIGPAPWSDEDREKARAEGLRIAEEILGDQLDRETFDRNFRRDWGAITKEKK